MFAHHALGLVDQLRLGNVHLAQSTTPSAQHLLPPRLALQQISMRAETMGERGVAAVMNA